MISSTNNSQQRKVGLIFWDILWTIFWLFLLALVLLKFLVFQHVTVVGKSMYPNYDNGQLLLVNQVNKKFSRGQVVAVYEKEDVAREATYITRFTARFFLKRIVGLPGEEIEILGGDVVLYNQNYPNGVLLNEPYIPVSTKTSEDQRNYYYPRTRIPIDSYFVMGDNRSNSTDSRSDVLGPVKDYAMFGQETIRFWPVSDVEVFDLPEYSVSSIDSDLESKRESLQNINQATNARVFRSR